MKEKFKCLERPLIDGIRPGCEKKIVWYGDVRQQRDLAVVYLHGFSASRMETWPLCDRLAAVLGANLFYTRLTGHGQDGRAMGNATVGDWLAAQPSVAPRLHSLILLSPNFMHKNPLALLALWPPGLRLCQRLLGDWRCFTAVNAAQSRYWTVRYPFAAIATMMRLVRLSWRIDSKNISMPSLMMINPWDRVINVTLAAVRFSRFASPTKKRVWFRHNRDLGRHVLAGEALSPRSTDQALECIRAYLESVGQET
jgi:esterase/lipase